MVDRWTDRWTIGVIVRAAEDEFAYTAEQAEHILQLLRGDPGWLHPLEEEQVLGEITHAVREYRAAKAEEKSRPKPKRRGNPGKPALAQLLWDLDRIGGLGVFPGHWRDTLTGPQGATPDFIRACIEPFMSPEEQKETIGYLCTTYLRSAGYGEDRAKIRQYEARDFVGPDSETVTRRMEEHFGLVVDTANRYLGRGLCLPELVQAGQIGLYDAAKKFDPSRRFKFSTYAVGRITGEINRALREANPEAWASVLIPHAGGMSEVRPQLVSLGNVEPTKSPEVVERPSTGVGREERQRRENERVSRQACYPPMQARGRHARSVERASADPDLWKTGEAFGEEAKEYPDSYELAEESPAARHARTLFEHLEPREREILERGWGLFGRGEETNAAIGKTLGITKARVGQIRKRALEKLSDVSLPVLTGAVENGGRAEGWRWSFGSPEDLARALREYSLDYVGLRTVPDAEPPMEEELERADEALSQYQRNGEIDRTMRALLRAGLSAPWWAIDRHFRRGGWGGHGATEEPTEAITILFDHIQAAQDATIAPRRGRTTPQYGRKRYAAGMKKERPPV